MTRDDLAERFAAVGPWFTRFVVDGCEFGGEADYSPDLEPDGRVWLFFEWFGRPRTILELGSFEGAHTLMLAAAEPVERVLGLEGREQNVRRAQLAAELLGRGNIAFHQADLENVELASYGRFDAVFCAGVLYHLPEPWRLLEAIGAVSDQLFLDTHYAAQATDERGGFGGAEVAEGGYDDSLSGLSSSSFWLTLRSLREALDRAGFAIEEQVDYPDWVNGPRAHLGCRRRR